MTHLIGTRISHEEKVNFLIGFLLLLFACILIACKVLVGDNSVANNLFQNPAASVVLAKSPQNKVDASGSALDVGEKKSDDDSP